MDLSVNLRSDLAKMSDAELAARLDESWDAYDAANRRRGKASWLASLLCRGPVRHRGVYRFLFALGQGTGSILDFVLIPLLSHRKLEKTLRKVDPNVDADLAFFEARDVMDEMQRRVERRKAQEV